MNQGKIPIQIIPNNRINQRPGEACNGYNGNLNSWFYGLNPQFKQNMQYLYNNIGILAQTNPEYSPYYKNILDYDPKLMNFLENLEKCRTNI